MLSQLDGVDLDLYQNTVLPRILEQVVNCKDDIAQPYLMDAVIQARVSLLARACAGSTAWLTLCDVRIKGLPG